MLYSIKNVEDLQNLKELVSLQKQLQEVRLQDKLGVELFRLQEVEPITDEKKILLEK